MNVLKFIRLKLYFLKLFFFLRQNQSVAMQTSLCYDWMQKTLKGGGRKTRDKAAFLCSV